MTSRGHPFAGAGAGRAGLALSCCQLAQASCSPGRLLFQSPGTHSLTIPCPPWCTELPCPHLEMATSNQPTTRELANLWAELTQTQPSGGQGQTQSFAVLFLGQWVGEAAGAAAGERLGGSGLFSGRTAPARTGGVPGGSPWTRSMDAQGRPWLRSAGWGRTAGVAGEEGGGGNTEPWGGHAGKGDALQARQPVRATPGIRGQGTISRPARKVIPGSERLEAESVRLLPTWGSLASVPASGADRLLSRYQEGEGQTCLGSVLGTLSPSEAVEGPLAWR